jgi:hypothetical protein
VHVHTIQNLNQIEVEVPDKPVENPALIVLLTSLPNQLNLTDITFKSVFKITSSTFNVTLFQILNIPLVGSHKEMNLLRIWKTHLRNPTSQST